ncbi:hypothetical protein J2Y88_000656 [Pseudomonas chlororaphis]|uniref:hypothetical protein n=1 Tax=Pseudomonas chlororaphis TaxID=587753 RepID=UPI00209CEFB9|nr:hypothetical protein [Pseudomonas chlororaphis]MCP1478345.1 hypothetical protein [Pseudomonas chlororaphis]MCP1595303.1 hypothetical protein [Pseudomonas chlororaphis]
MQFIDTMNFIASSFDGLFSKEVFIALAAAYIGARATSKATIRAHELATQKSKNDEREVTCNTLRLIRAELVAAWDIYMFEYGRGLLLVSEDAPYIMTLPIGDNPFPIYDSAPPCLANVDPAISAKIVRIYMRTKGLITMIKLNNADCQVVYNAGRYATQSLVNKAISDGVVIDEEGARKLNEYHTFYVEQEAKQLGMGGTANGMKLMTGELGELLSEIKKEIDKLTSNAE